MTDEEFIERLRMRADRGDVMLDAIDVTYIINISGRKYFVSKGKKSQQLAYQIANELERYVAQRVTEALTGTHK